MKRFTLNSAKDDWASDNENGGEDKNEKRCKLYRGFQNISINRTKAGPTEKGGMRGAKGG